MSVTPGPCAVPPSTRNGRWADRARVEHGVHVADQQHRRPVGRRHRRMATSVPVASASGVDLDSRPSSCEDARWTQRADLVHARPWCSCRSRCPPGAAGRPGRRAGCASTSGQCGRARRAGSRSVMPRVYGRRGRSLDPARAPAAILRAPCDSSEIRLLDGPNVYRLEPTVKLEVARRPATHLVRRADPRAHARVDWLRHGARAGPREVAGSVRAATRRGGVGGQAPPTAATGRVPRDHPSDVGAGPLDRGVPLARGRARSRHRRGRRSAHGAGPATRARPGPRPADGAGRAAAGPSRGPCGPSMRPDTDPPAWIRDADRRMPGDQHQRHQRQDDHDPDDRRTSCARRAATWAPRRPTGCRGRGVWWRRAT